MGIVPIENKRGSGSAKLRPNELYRDGLGIEKWDNTNYKDSQLSNKNAVIYSEYIQIDAPNGYVGHIGTNDKIDLSAYSRVLAEVTLVKANNSSYGFINLCTDKATHIRGGEFRYTQIRGNVGEKVVVAINVSDITSKYYISFYATDNRTYNINKVWLE